MTLLIILMAVFASVALMVILGERFGKPMEEGQQGKYSKIIMVLVGISLVVALVNQMV